ncbi:hypothetical protein QJS10_CPA01g01839 [Acorus calamus]|uniref:DCD domain-containing protein n=1 Tax=Acorus calamus TaxID=4465 RepID=A0AAV9FN33_ACOCL|nr:hypothetical protein QJS10_CPA01g01839 [Acorus calamus]
MEVQLCKAFSFEEAQIGKTFSLEMRPFDNIQSKCSSLGRQRSVELPEEVSTEAQSKIRRRHLCRPSEKHFDWTLLNWNKEVYKASPKKKNNNNNNICDVGGKGKGGDNNKGSVDKRFKSLPASKSLRRNEAIVGYIFVCNNDTMQESFSDASFGGTNIDPLAWEDKKCPGESRFPAQVRVLNKKICEPLEEDSFRPILHHYDGPKFRLEISIPEALALLGIFTENNA